MPRACTGTSPPAQRGFTRVAAPGLRLPQQPRERVRSNGTRPGTVRGQVVEQAAAAARLAAAYILRVLLRACRREGPRRIVPSPSGAGGEPVRRGRDEQGGTCQAGVGERNRAHQRGCPSRADGTDGRRSTAPTVPPTARRPRQPLEPALRLPRSGAGWAEKGASLAVQAARVAPRHVQPVG